MKKKIEATYGKALKSVLFVVNPIKKLIINTHCMAHKYITNKAIDILKNEGHLQQYNHYQKYIKELNEGVTWADQDFKSSGHFYHFSKEKGLYGCTNALDECKKYYNKANTYLELGDIKKSMFYLGAACHLIQDTTVPQHVNNKLLKHHRKFELWIIKKIAMGHHFEVKNGIKTCESVDEYIKNNALTANNTYLKYINTKDIDERYMKIASSIIQEAQITTAGFMLDFYETLKEKTEC
ncbi:zinc dependent phospholipase C family protein [Clostridium ganghwense]|uniref:Phospholipase C n=1 Tax=Clostridium ganghwense TaxID=312089 RepID=A0ABT4CPH0_9CLOT|nr:zinc dependent phospholipase C family protein [Clostridium ganghwense]MCY6370848.1 zinc dependent phospholipase C family protein [Clostridium ganghwense]